MPAVQHSMKTRTFQPERVPALFPCEYFFTKSALPAVDQVPQRWHVFSTVSLNLIFTDHGNQGHYQAQPAL